MKTMSVKYKEHQQIDIESADSRKNESSFHKRERNERLQEVTSKRTSIHYVSRRVRKTVANTLRQPESEKRIVNPSEGSWFSKTWFARAFCYKNGVPKFRYRFLLKNTPIVNTAFDLFFDDSRTTPENCNNLLNILALVNTLMLGVVGTIATSQSFSDLTEADTRFSFASGSTTVNIYNQSYPVYWSMYYEYPPSSMLYIYGSNSLSLLFLGILIVIYIYIDGLSKSDDLYDKENAYSLKYTGLRDGITDSDNKYLDTKLQYDMLVQQIDDYESIDRLLKEANELSNMLEKSEKKLEESKNALQSDVNDIESMISTAKLHLEAKTDQYNEILMNFIRHYRYFPTDDEDVKIIATAEKKGNKKRIFALLEKYFKQDKIDNVDDDEDTTIIVKDTSGEIMKNFDITSLINYISEPKERKLWDFKKFSWLQKDCEYLMNHPSLYREEYVEDYKKVYWENKEKWAEIDSIWVASQRAKLTVDFEMEKKESLLKRIGEVRDEQVKLLRKIVLLVSAKKEESKESTVSHHEDKGIAENMLAGRKNILEQRTTLVFNAWFSYAKAPLFLCMFTTASACFYACFAIQILFAILYPDYYMARTGSFNYYDDSSVTGHSLLFFYFTFSLGLFTTAIASGMGTSAKYYLEDSFRMTDSGTWVTASKFDAEMDLMKQEEIEVKRDTKISILGRHMSQKISTSG